MVRLVRGDTSRAKHAPVVSLGHQMLLGGYFWGKKGPLPKIKRLRINFILVRSSISCFLEYSNKLSRRTRSYSKMNLFKEFIFGGKCYAHSITNVPSHSIINSYAPYEKGKNIYHDLASKFIMLCAL